MSTRSFIAKEIGEDRYKTIYCHSDGYLTYNGAMLLDNYNSAERVDALLELGDLSCLDKKINPDPSRPHSFDYGERQDGVTVAYGRDRGQKGTEAKVMLMNELDDPNNWTEYVYIFTKNNEWKYFRSGHSDDGLRDVNEDLIKKYSQFDMERPEGYYGFFSKGIAEELKNEEAQDDLPEPALSM